MPETKETSDGQHPDTDGDTQVPTQVQFPTSTESVSGNSGISSVTMGPGLSYGRPTYPTEALEEVEEEEVDQFETPTVRTTTETAHQKSIDALQDQYTEKLNLPVTQSESEPVPHSPPTVGTTETHEKSIDALQDQYTEKLTLSATQSQSATHTPHTQQALTSKLIDEETKIASISAGMGDATIAILPLPSVGVPAHSPSTTPGAHPSPGTPFGTVNNHPAQVQSPPQTPQPPPEPVELEARLVGEDSARREDEDEEDPKEVIVAEPLQERNNKAPLVMGGILLLIAIIVLIVVVVLVVAIGVDNNSDQKEEVEPQVEFEDVPIEQMEKEEDEESDPKCIQSIQELYDAIDLYYQITMNMNSTGANNISQEVTTLSQIYGHPIGTWCVRGLTLFASAFAGTRDESIRDESLRDTAVHFVADIGNWDMSTALDLKEMFEGCKNMSADWGFGNWNTTSIQSLEGLFTRTEWSNRGNIDLGGWDTSNVASMTAMIQGANDLHTLNMSGWDTSKVKSIRYMAYFADEFNDDLSMWNTSSLVDMDSAFWGANSFDPDLSRWDTKNVHNLHGAFWNNTRFNSDISQWNMASATNLQNTFNRCSNFNQSLKDWDVSGVTTFQAMFHKARSFNQDLSGWNVSSATSTEYMFENAESFQQNLCVWGKLLQPNVITVGMFSNTNCPNTSDPVIPHGPFCFNCDGEMNE